MPVRFQTKSKPRVAPRRTALAGRSPDVLEVAAELFLSHGYAGVTLQMIVAKTGGSYRDLYQEFGGKKKLFVRVISVIASDVLAPLRSTFFPTEGQLPIEVALEAIGNSVLRTLLSPRLLALHRLAVSEAPRFPAVAKTFFRMGPQAAYDALAEFLRRRSASDCLLIEDYSSAAAIFLDMLTNNLQLRALTGGKVRPSEISERVRQATHIFLHGVIS